MPEGDTIFRAARTLSAALTGQEVTRFDAAYAHLKAVDDQTPLKGRQVERVHAVGKHLLMHFSGDLVLRTHMLMSGSWHIYRPGEKWFRSPTAMRVLVETPAYVAVGFDIPIAKFESERSLQRSAVGKLGPDLLGAFDMNEALRRLREQGDSTIAEALLNQRVVAGIGNVFKSEILFDVGVNPHLRVREVAEDKLKPMMETSLKYLAANVLQDSGDRIVTYSGFRRTTRRADPAERLWVYGRGGKPCRKCGTRIEMFKQGLEARVTFFCPRCQLASADIKPG